MASRKPNGSYLVRLRTPDGRVSRVFPTLTEAEAWERTAKDALKRGMPIPSNGADDVSVLSFFSGNVDYLWPSSNNLPNLRAQAIALAEFFGGDRGIATITARDAIMFRKEMMDKHRAGSTINNYAAVFNRLMEHANKMGYNPNTPTMDYAKQRKGKVRFLSEAEEERLTGYFTFIGRDDYADMVTILIYTGARVGEVLGIKLDDLTDRTVTLWDTKSGEPRTVPLTTKCKAAIQRRKAEARTNKLWAFGYQTFKTSFDKAVAKCQLDNVTPHTLRHTCASRLVQRGVDIRRVKDWLGHASIQTTMIYAHLAPEDLFSAASVLDNDGSVTKMVTAG